MNDHLDQLLADLKLPQIRSVIDKEMKRAEKDGISYSDFLIRLFDQEHAYRRDRSLQFRIQQAKLPELWSLETFPFKRQPSVQQKQIRQIAELDFIPQSTNLIFIGETGVGKTGLASAILIKALHNGYRGLFITAQNLFDQLYESLADRSTRNLVNRLMRIDVLLIDELGYLAIRPEQSHIFFKLMEERYRKKPTIITTNLDYDDWYSFLGQKKMVAALLDRVRHHCISIRIDGPSLRLPQQQTAKP